MSLYDKASLVLIPSGTKTGKVFSQKPTSGDGDFDFTRSTQATRVNSQGLIEKERGNLLLQSDSFDTTWSRAGITLTGGESGYDGSSDAWELEKDANQFRRIEQNVTISGVHTFSCYGKKGTLDNLVLWSNAGRAEFDLTNGVVSNTTSGVVASSIVQIGSSEWYRCSAVFDANNTQFRIYADWNQTVAGTIYIQDAQVEQGLVATDVIETTTAAVYTGITDNVPRLDYDGDCPSLLLEPQRTNEVEHSEYMEDSIWIKQSGVTVDSNTSDTTSPEGKYNANKITSTDGTKGVYINTFSKTTDIVRTVYMKGENGGESITIKDGGGFGGQTIVTLTTEWVRYEHKTTSDGNNYQGMFLDDIPTTSAIYVWGAQVEEGSYATSYVPCYGTSVTRSVDKIATKDITDIITGDSFTWFLDLGDWQGSDVNSNDFYIANSVDGIKIEFRVRSNGYRVNYSGIQGDSGYPTAASTTANKFCISYDGQNYRLYRDGIKITTTSSVGDTGWDEFSQRGGLGTASTIPLKQMTIFDTALTDQECIDLTT